MTLGQSIKAHRQRCGMTQQAVADSMELSRQAVTNWERDISAPGTQNLIKLAELFGIGVDELISAANEPAATQPEAAAQKHGAALQPNFKQNCLNALLIAALYAAIYIIGRIIWCNGVNNSVMGMLFTAAPQGEHSYLYGWLLSSNMLYYAAAISLIPAFWGKRLFCISTFGGFVLGLAAGILFGPDPQHAAIGQGDRGWLIWGIIFIISALLGLAAEIIVKRKNKAW